MANITLGGAPTTTNKELPKAGDTLENFKFTANDMSEVSLNDYKGKNIILNIFPSVDTGVCATSVRKFNKEVAGKDNTVVLCISKDLPFAQKRLCGAEGIDNAITLSDFKNPEFAESIGTAIQSGAFEGLNARAVVVIDSGGKVVHSQLVSEIGNEPDYDAALNSIKG